jgi:RNAse (barnase) inhibitor barstar
MILGVSRREELKLNLAGVKTREELHELLFSCFGLPDYYGANWDAFWEIINDSPILPKLLIIEGWQNFRRALPREAELMLNCLAEFTRENSNSGFEYEFVGDVPEYTCPCCGYVVFRDPPGSYEICPICFWEDDALQLEFASTLAGGANAPTLVEAQRYYREYRVSEPRLRRLVRSPGTQDRLDPDWRPIDPAADRFPDWGAEVPERAPRTDESLYYWRPEFWFKSPSG